MYPLGCSGVITHVESLADGRYNIVLRGVERFRILEEDLSLSYRRAVVEPEPEAADSGDPAVLRRQRARLEALLAPAIERSLSGAGRLESIGTGGRDPRFPLRWPTRTW